MKSTFETFLIPMGILMLGFLSALLLPAPWFGVQLTKSLMATFHLQDIGQLYTLVFCLWFLLLGAIEYFVIRYIYRRYFKI
ncbi:MULTISPECIES: DUF1158 domain-containing protein [Winslowiella]|uniref:DUF1158 domain-containing protein n=1 Tax=Winslowiella TaxID=2997349 RepID=UPI0028BE0A4A|nr:DUF1158 domain-containing protein [Winslowiella toletana]WNN44459.1 DUF1158 domain-containing protein [Winslowiella toletana]